MAPADDSTRRAATARHAPRYRKALALVTLAVLAFVALQIHLAIRDHLVARREEMVLPFIRQAAQKHGLSVSLVRALVWKESRFQTDAVGSKGETGLMQVTSGAVADWAAATRNPVPTRTELFTAETNLDIGCWFLARALSRWKGYTAQELLALAEYNAGRTKVVKEWAPEDPADPLLPEQITFPSTQSYVRQIQSRRAYYEHLEATEASSENHHD